MKIERKRIQDAEPQRNNEADLFIAKEDEILYYKSFNNKLIKCSGESEPITYGNVSFVDSTNGSDATGGSNIFNKPYSTVAAAQANLTGTVTAPALVILRKGVYTENILLKPYIYIYCEPGVVFTAGGFYDDINSVDTKVFGNASFYFNTNISVVTLLYSTKLYFEADTINITGISFAPFRLHPVVTHTPVMTAKIKTFYHACDNTSAINVRGKASFYGTFENEVKHSYQFLNTTVSNGDLFSGKIVINAPKITMMDGGVLGNVSTRKTMFMIQNASSAGEVTINADVVEDQTVSYLGGYHSIVATHSNSTCKVLINARVVANYAVGYLGGLVLSDSGIVKFTNNVSSKVRVCYVGFTSTGIFKEGILTKLVEATTTAFIPVYVYASGTVFLKESDIENLETNSSLIYADLATSKVYVDKVTGKQTGTSGFFITSPNIPVTAISSTISNVALDSTIVNLVTPNSFTVVAGLVLPTF